MKRKSVYVARDLDGTLAIFPEANHAKYPKTGHK